MTLEELRLRIEVAFPGAAPMSPRGRDTPEIGTRVEVGGVKLVVAWCDCVDCQEGGGEELWSVGVDQPVFQRLSACERAAFDETKRRLLSVTSHDMIAARRRLTESADAH